MKDFVKDQINALLADDSISEKEFDQKFDVLQARYKISQQEMQIILDEINNGIEAAEKEVVELQDKADDIQAEIAILEAEKADLKRRFKENRE